MRALALLPVVALSACATTAAEPPLVGGDGICQHDTLARFYGQVASQALGADLLGASRAKILRWVPHDGMVTMDFRQDRLTVQLDPANRVVSARCG